MRHERLPNGDHYIAERGVMIIGKPAPHVQLISGHGFALAEFVAPILASRNRMIEACGRIALFDDLELVSGYDTKVRVELTAWARANDSRIISHHILTRSKLVAMGVSVASLALGSRIRGHSRRIDFENAMSAELKRDLPAA